MTHDRMTYDCMTHDLIALSSLASEARLSTSPCFLPFLFPSCLSLWNITRGPAAPRHPSALNPPHASHPSPSSLSLLPSLCLPGPAHPCSTAAGGGSGSSAATPLSAAAPPPPPPPPGSTPVNQCPGGERACSGALFWAAGYGGKR